MTDEPHTYLPDETRSPYSALRACEPQRDQRARAHALGLLERHIEARGQRTPSAARRRPRLPRRLLAPAIALVVVAGAGGAVASVLLRTQHTDRLAVFTPQGALAPGFRVGTRGRGYCWEASLAAQTRGAYRCFQGNEIHDPCFAASAHAATVACFIDPWRSVTVLRLTRRLPRHGASQPGTVLPWAILTTGGRRCVFMTGATALVGDQRVNYGCADGSYLIGSPDTRQPLWTIRSVRRFTVKEMHAPLSRFPLVTIRQTIG